MKPILFSLTLVFTTLACFAQDYYGNNRKQWLQKAEQLLEPSFMSYDP